jgi:hypothetical protein
LAVDPQAAARESVDRAVQGGAVDVALAVINRPLSFRSTAAAKSSAR